MKKTAVIILMVNLIFRINIHAQNLTIAEHPIPLDYFEHNAGKLTLLANHTGLHDYGFYLGSGGIGDQIADNYDVDGSDDCPSNEFDNSNVKDLGASPIGQLTIYELYPGEPSISYNPSNFNVYTNNASNNFISSLDCGNYEPPHAHEEEIVREGERIAGDTILNETNDETYDWLSKLSLMKKLLTSSALMDSSSILTMFYDSTLYSGIGIIGRLDEGYAKLNDSTLTDTTERNTLLSGMKASNDSIASSKLFELNAQLVNGVFINSLGGEKDSLTDDDKEVIDFVAMQCPYTGGNAVYLARALRCLYEKPMYYDDHCTAQMRQEQAEEDSITTMDFGVIPNPADGEVKFTYSENFNGLILVTDALGRTVKVLAPEKNSTEVETMTERWAAGIYFIKFVDSSGITELKKLVITH